MAGKRRYVRSVEPELLTPAQFLAMGAQPDGTVVRVALDATGLANVALRYNAGSASAYKWESVGLTTGLEAHIAAQSNLQAITGAYSNCADVPGPSITLPLGGEWEFSAGTTFAYSVNGGGSQGVGLNIGGGDIAGELFLGRSHFSMGNPGGAVLPSARVGSLVAGQVVLLRYFAVGASQTSIAASGRRLIARPFRVLGP